MFFNKLYYRMINNYRSLSSETYSETKKEFYLKRIYPKALTGLKELVGINTFRLDSSNTIEFKGFQFGTSDVKVLKSLGDPNYIHLKTIEQNNYQILFYREEIAKFKVITQIHFINDVMFFASYSFNTIDKKERNEIRKILFEKYTNETIDTNSENIIIEDQLRNKVILHEDVNLRISYLSGSQQVQDVIDGMVFTSREKITQSDYSGVSALYLNL